MKNNGVKIIRGITLSLLSLFMFVLPVSAHVTVKPASVGVGAFQTFTIGVPTEKDMPTINVKLVLPEGLNYVSPNVKPGWTINIKKTGDGEEAKVTEIDWSGGSIPSGQRDEFIFSAQVPATETTLKWKAYQTYQNGDVVSWDQEPAGSDDEKVTPYSSTNVVNDLAVSNTAIAVKKTEDDSDKIWQGLTMVAAVLSVVAIGMQLRKKA